jgi:hypothetical protein
LGNALGEFATGGQVKRLMTAAAVGIVSAAIIFWMPLSATTKTKLPRACAAALSHASDAFTATDSIFSDPNDPALRLEDSLYYGLLVNVTARDSGGINNAIGQIQARETDVWDAEAGFYSALYRCQKVTR